MTSLLKSIHPMLGKFKPVTEPVPTRKETVVPRTARKPILIRPLVAAELLELDDQRSLRAALYAD